MIISALSGAAFLYWLRSHLQCGIQRRGDDSDMLSFQAACSHALSGECFSWYRQSRTSSQSSFITARRSGGVRRLIGHQIAVEEGIALSRRGTDSSRLQLMLMDRDFSSEDYEVLSRLDENEQDACHLLGATDAELERLPTYIVETETKQNKCFICLNDFLKGEVVRILPCLHQFHQSECCDPWLRRKMECPVCKFKL